MRQLLVISVLALVALGSSSGAARAAQAAPVQITATFVGPQIVTAYRQADGNTFITFTQDMTLSGEVTGSLTETGTLELHPNGSGTDQAMATGTWTVDGRTGEVTLIATLSIEPNRPMVAQGHFTIVNATAGLAHLHGEGSIIPGSVGATLLAYLSFDA